LRLAEAVRASILICDIEQMAAPSGAGRTKTVSLNLLTMGPRQPSSRRRS
jgi:hypothetical protein